MEQSKKWEMKAPLRNCWTLWFLDGSESEPGEKRLTEVGSFTTIDDFWSFFNNVKPVSSIKYGCDYSLFKTGIRPIWEDTANMTGGRWIIDLDKNLPPQKLDQYWLDLALCMIGQNFAGPNTLICGATVNLRANSHRIALWLRDTNNEDGQVVQIGISFKVLLGFGPDQVIKFLTDLDEQNKDESGQVKTTYYL